MYQIRRGVFETNSSSTHSITITKWQKPKEKLIPRNYNSIYIVEEYGDVGGGECEYVLHTHYDEVDKLRYIVNMLATVYDNIIGSENFILLVNRDLFVWLKEVVQEETGTRIEFEKPNSKYFPYFETTYSDEEDIRDLLDLTEVGDSFDKEKFKARVREIIFNKDIVIYNENLPYGFEDAGIKEQIGGM